MVGSPPVPLRRWLAPVASLLRLQPPVRPTSPPGLPPLSRTEILARYRRLRQISTQQHEAVLDIIAADVLLDWAKRIDMTDGKAIVLENEMEKTLPEDLAIYLPRPGRSHPIDRYARITRFAPGSDEAIVLAAMRRARFSLWRVEQRHPTTGLILRDLLRDKETWLVDETLEKTARPGLEMAARLLQPESFAMTARIIVPMLPDLMTRPELMDEVFTRAPALKRLQGDDLAGDPRFAIGIYRAAVATETMERVRFKRK
ncbi:MAG: hypothetical protein QOH05_1349 [Acetobacteraceae bacterium]|jgi:hypothetical protein|nr:hypothetical protein [Acetobacteraceae bacterium]